MSDHPVRSDAAFLSSLGGFAADPPDRPGARQRRVAVEQIATSADRPVVEAERLLRSQPGTECDDNGRLVGLGLTSRPTDLPTYRPTDHRFSVKGQSLYTWCATDTPFAP